MQICSRRQSQQVGAAGGRADQSGRTPTHKRVADSLPGLFDALQRKSRYEGVIRIDPSARGRDCYARFHKVPTITDLAFSPAFGDALDRDAKATLEARSLHLEGPAVLPPPELDSVLSLLEVFVTIEIDLQSFEGGGQVLAGTGNNANVVPAFER